MSNMEEDPKFAEWFSEPYIEDDGFSERLYLSLDKLGERRNRVSRIITMLIMLSSLVIGLVYMFLEGFTKNGGIDFVAFIGIVFMTVILSLEPET